MTEFSFTPHVQCKGRNPFRSDAIRIEMLKAQGEPFVYIENRVASTGKYNMGWLAVPGNPHLIRQIAAKLTKIADEIEGKT